MELLRVAGYGKKKEICEVPKVPPLGSFSFSVGACIPPVPIHRGFIGEGFPNPDTSI